MDVITPIFTMLAFGLSVYNTILILKDKRRDFSIEFDEMYVQNYIGHHDEKQDAIKFKYTISNHSQLPIAITKIRLLINNTYYDVDYIPHYVEQSGYHQGGKIICEDVLTSVVLPIRLEGLGASIGFLTYVVPRGIITGNETSFSALIFTNRGDPIETELTLNKAHTFTTKVSPFIDAHL